MPGFAPAAFALPTLTVWGQAVKEGDSGTRNLAFTVTLAPPSDQRVTVRVDTGPAPGDTHALTDFSAPGGPDYVPVTARTLTFEPGETQKTVDVPVNGDRMDEPRWERFALHLSNAVNADIETHSAVGYIMDDDPLPSLTVRSRTVSEGDSGTRTVSFTAALSAATGQEVIVYFDIGDGTATEGEDYRVPFRPRPHQMIISGKRFQRQGTFEVEILGDTLEEGDETFRVELSSPTNVVLPDAAITGTITDDDDGTDPMTGGNTAPTASDGSVSVLDDVRSTPRYTFGAGDFNFADADPGDALASVRIVAPPSPGSLALDDVAVTASQVVTKAQLDAGELSFQPDENAWGNGYATFTFRVSDGTTESADAYAMTIDVVEVSYEELARLMLVDAATGVDLGNLATGPAVSAGGAYGVRADVDTPRLIGSVVFSLQGPIQHRHTDDQAPYSLFGDVDGVVNGRSLRAGPYTLSATAHAESDGTGRVLGRRVHPFTVEAVEAVVPPSPATGLTASSATQTTVGLSWALPAQDSGVTVTGVEVQQQAADESWSTVATLAADATSHTVTGLTAGTAYSFRVRLNANSEYAVSDAVSATTLAAANPATGLTASGATQSTVDLSWTLPTQPEGVSVTGVEVQQQAADESWTAVATLASDATTHTVTGLTAGTSYTFRIRVVTSSGNADSEPAEAQTAHTPLEVEMSGSVPESDDGALRAGTGAQGCRVDVEVRFLDADGNAVAVDALAATDFTVGNGHAGTPVADADGLGWTVPVRATTNKRGLLRVRLPATERWRAAEQVFHNYGAGVCATAARGELAALRVEEISLSPSFTSTTTSYTGETTDADAEVVGEAVYTDATVTIAPVDADEVADGHQLALAEGETEVTVTVTPGDGSAAKTYTVTVTRETADSPVPAPVNLQAVGGDEQVTLTWTAPEYGGSITGYEYRFCRVTSPTQCHYQEWKSTESTTSHTVKYWYIEHGGQTYRFRLSNGRKYRFQVRALAGDAEGLSSVEVEATPVAAPTPPPSGVLTGFVLLDASDQSTVAALAEGADIDLGGRSGGSFAIRADVASDATVGSVALSLSGAKTVSATENYAPYSLWGDHNDGNGGRALDGATLPAGTYTLTATAYAERRASGTVLGTLSVSFEVLAPAALSVADARAEEGTDATLDFAVTLDRETTATVTVDYATSDGTATAGEDYTATSGTLTFAAGEMSKTVSVPVLDDGRDEGEETLTLRLTNAQGATIADGEAVGTIANSDPVQRMWLSRFGRTVGSQVVDAVAERLGGPLAGSQVTLGGQRIDLSRPDDEAALAEAVTGLAGALGGEPGGGRDPDDGFSGSGAWPARWSGTWDGSASAAAHRSMSGRELLLGSAFHLSSGGDTGGPVYAAWGRVTSGGFDAQEAHAQGAVRMDGDVTTGILGADAAWSRWLAGVAVSVSEGEGTYDYPGADDRGTLGSSLTGVHPYARLQVNERVQAWGLLGFGSGEMTMRQAPNEHRDHAVVTRTDIEMRLGAVGARGALLEAGETGGLDLALKADAFLVQMESAKAANTEATQADASRLRLALEGSRSFALGEGVSLTPGLDVGLRHDGGDAETGTGVEVGGRIAWADAASGLSMEASARTLIAHEDSGYEEWGASGSVRIDPGASGRGLSLTVAPALGAASSGMERLWSLHQARGLAANDDFEAQARLDAELGYGLPAFGVFTGTPYAGLGLSDSGRDYRLGGRLAPAGAGLDLSLGLEATLKEPANDDVAPERGVMLRGALRW